jgi:hypothetical protein
MHLLRTAMISLVVLAATTGMATTKAPQPNGKRELVNGARSVDALLDQFLASLAAKDEHALHRLRVTEQEYRGIIIPGTVKPGEPPRQVEDTPSQYFWRMLDQKSQDVGHLFIQRFGGQRYTRKEVTYTKGVRKFLGYTAIGEVRLHLEDASGTETILPTGSIAEVNGRYKFIGFNYNN